MRLAERFAAAAAVYDNGPMLRLRQRCDDDGGEAQAC
jgi:hypothetical protein